MSLIIGQSKLLATINSFTKQTLPKTLLFIGPAGCGKHTMAKYLAQHIELDVVNIDEDTSASDLEAFLFKTVDTLYIIDLNKFSEKAQNQFLKFIEEPSKSVYIVLLANSEAGILPTVLNRCTKYAFEPYTQTELKSIINTSVPDRAFEIFNTPGKLLNLTASSFDALIALGEKVVTKIGQVPYGSALVIATRINYKDLYSKIDFDLFFDVVEFLALEDFKNNNNKQSLIIFTITNKYKQKALQASLIKEALMYNYLTVLWEALQNDTN